MSGNRFSFCFGTSTSVDVRARVVGFYCYSGAAAHGRKRRSATPQRAPVSHRARGGLLIQWLLPCGVKEPGDCGLLRSWRVRQ
jgi:hypothetical protein